MGYYAKTLLSEEKSIRYITIREKLSEKLSMRREKNYRKRTIGEKLLARRVSCWDTTQRHYYRRKSIGEKLPEKNYQGKTIREKLSVSQAGTGRVARLGYYAQSLLSLSPFALFVDN